MRRALARVGVVLVTGCVVLGGVAGSAHAAPGGPSSHASCIGKIFVPQATGDPGTVARRIAEIKRDLLPLLGTNFGEPISGLARVPKTACFD